MGPRAMPPLMYRYFDATRQGINSSEGFGAGLFVENGQAAPIQDFARHFVNHLTPIKVPTPFISLYEYPLAAVHRALRSQQAHIAVIDPVAIDRILKLRLGLEHQYVISAGDTVKSMDLKLKGYYPATTEWLAWGTVPNEAILCTFSAQRLWNLTERDDELGQLLRLDIVKKESRIKWHLAVILRDACPPLTPAAGELFGKLCKDLTIPERAVVPFVTQITHVWQYRGHRCGQFWQAVRLGFQSATETMGPQSSHINDFPWARTLGPPRDDLDVIDEDE